MLYIALIILVNLSSILLLLIIKTIDTAIIIPHIHNGTVILADPIADAIKISHGLVSINIMKYFLIYLLDYIY